MNKTVNINLAGIFFHIDEDAYLKLQHYIEAIKRSFTDSQGRDEIIADIEARIAELFNERVQNSRQVVGIKEVDDVISIMGQPEDYLVDDDIFEDEPQPEDKKKTVRPKKLFRDTDNSYIGGVSSGLGHYFGIDPLWIRLAWFVLFFGAGTGVLLYILLWILVPEAKTTAEKIMMTGEPVNISNIEKKIKDGFENVKENAKNVSDQVGTAAKNVSDSISDAAKKVDFEKQGNKIKSSSKTFFDTIGEIIMFFFKIFAKLIGAILIIIGASTLIALIITLLSLGVVDLIHLPGLDLIDVFNAGNTPIWLVSLLTFFAVGVPFFFVFYLGLKILINNLKSIGNIAKFTLLGVWLIAIIGLIVVGVSQASEHAFDERIVEEKALQITANDTVNLKMIGNDLYKNGRNRQNESFKLIRDENKNRTIYASDISILVKSTTDSLAKISINKSAHGRNYAKAIERAKNIKYNYSLKDDVLLLDSYFTTDYKNKFSDQEIVFTLYLPEGAVIKCHENSKTFFYYSNHNGTIITYDNANQYLRILEDGIECLDCSNNEEYNINVDVNDEKSAFKVNEKGIEITVDSASLKIDNTGIKVNSNEVKVNIDEDGISIKSKND